MTKNVIIFVLGVFLAAVFEHFRSRDRDLENKRRIKQLEAMNEKLKELLLKAKEGEMRASPFYCKCGHKLWEDEGKFYKINDDGTWSGELTHCPKCQSQIQGQEGTEEGCLKS